MDLSDLTKLPLNQLSSSVNVIATYIHGIVTLIWPYSSTTQTISFLLVEPDFRLRRQKGQVRISLRGATARRVARQGIASGDELKLRLTGAELVSDAGEEQTPGRSCGWEIVFDKGVQLEVRNSTKLSDGS